MRVGVVVSRLMTEAAGFEPGLIRNSPTGYFGHAATCTLPVSESHSQLHYFLVLVVPVLGWINASWRNIPVVMFGLELPKLTPAPGWQWTGDIHGLLANNAMLILVGLYTSCGG